MFTTCPKCSLTLVVTTGDLRAAQGFVRCGRCSNVFNAIANLSEDRSANADTSATGQQRTLQQPSPPAPREVAESGTPEESPRYEDSSARLSPAPARAPSPPQFATPAPAPQQRAPQQQSPQQSAPRPALPPQSAPPQRAPAQPPAARQSSAPQQSFAPRGTSLPPPTAEDLDDIPDISLEFDADTADISQVFVQQPARRLVLDGNTGTFETVALKEPPPEDIDDANDEFESQLRALAAQISPTPQPPPPQQVVQQAPPAPQARSAPAPRPPTPAPSRDTGATGNNPVLRIRPPTPEPAVARQTQVVPAQVAPQAKQSPPPQNREPAPAPRPAPATRAQLDEIPIEDVEVVVRQSTGAPSAAPVPVPRPSASPANPDPAPQAPQAKSKPARQPAQPKPSKQKAAARAKRAETPERQGRSPEELIQAAAEVVRSAGRKDAVANNGEAAYEDEDEPDINVVPDISESFPTRIRRRAFEAIETDGAALRARIPSLSWGAAAVAFSALFVLQVINHYRNELATSDRLRKPLTSLYGAFGVTLVPRWDIGGYEVRQLGALAGSGNRLTVRLSVKNGAKSAQPLPFLRVTVQDRFGNRIASRDVPPEVYSPKRAGTLLDADSRIDAEVAFVDPGQNAVGFEIDACLPTDSGRIACANDQIAR